MKLARSFIEILKRHNCVHFALPIFLLSLCTSFFLEAATTLVDTLPGKKRLSMIHYNNGTKIRGHIFGVTDSSVIVIKRKYLDSHLPNHQLLIPVERINRIERKQHGNLSTAANMGLGLLVGSIIGFSMGLSDCDDPNSDCGFFDQVFETNNFKAAVILSGALGSAGLIAGLFQNKQKKKRFAIGGRRSNLQQYKMDLLY